MTIRNPKRDTRYGVELASPMTGKVANTPQLMKRKKTIITMQWKSTTNAMNTTVKLYSEINEQYN